MTCVGAPVDGVIPRKREDRVYDERPAHEIARIAGRTYETGDATKGAADAVRS